VHSTYPNKHVLLQGGDLRAALDGPNASTYRWHARGARIAADVARGLAYIHSAGVVHR
jgi:serine/threonine protein kinase